MGPRGNYSLSPLTVRGMCPAVRSDNIENIESRADPKNEIANDANSRRFCTLLQLYNKSNIFAIESNNSPKNEMYFC